MHDKRRIYCRPCGGSAYCEHDRIRYSCRRCKGAAFCEHGKHKKVCKECGGSGICGHGRYKNKCKQCRVEQDTSSEVVGQGVALLDIDDCVDIFFGNL